MPSLPTLTITHCRLVLPDEVLPDAWIEVAEDRITDYGSGSRPAPATSGQVVDADGQLLAPGFVDVHCHGDGRTRFFDEPEGVARNLLRDGVTTVLATLGYPDMRPGLREQVQVFQDSLGILGKQTVGGIHLEGPYVNPKYGAQTTKGVIKPPDEREYHELLSTFPGMIKWWTCAPELPGGTDFIRAASEGGVIVGAGHTEATPEEIATAIDAGLKVIIHWSNATGNPHASAYAGTRVPGIDEAALVFDELSAEIIPDEKGLHVHPLMARLLYKAKGPDRILIITDAGYARPDDPPDSPAPRRDVSIDSDGNLAGSRLTMVEAARNFRRFSECSWPELFRMTSLNAAKLLRMDGDVGSIERGKRANLVLFDDTLQVGRVFLDGREVDRTESVETG